MKLIILVALALVAIAVAAPAEPIKIIRSSSDLNPDGSYVFGFETADGINREEQGEPKQVLDADKKPHEVVVSRGSFSFVTPEGQPVQITFVADENGYQPQGEVIPK